MNMMRPLPIRSYMASFEVIQKAPGIQKMTHAEKYTQFPALCLRVNSNPWLLWLKRLYFQLSQINL